MINNNFNGQNGVATSAAIKNAVVKAVKMINKAEIGKKTYVMIEEGLRLSFDGIRFIRGAKDNFIFNGKIEKKCSNGRYDHVLVEIHYKNLDNEEGLCLNDMVNGVLGAILADIDNWIMNYYKSESSSKWEAGLELYQNFRNDYFGSKLVVDNSEDLNSPDALDNDIESIMEFFGDDYKVLNDIENEFFGYHFDIDDDLRDNLLFKRNGTFIDMYYNNMVIINNSVYIRLTDIKNIRDFENALFKLISTLINNDENDRPDALIGFDASEVVSKLCNEMVNSETPYAFIKLDKYYLGCYLDLKEDEVGYKLIIPEWNEIKDFDMDNDDDVQELQEFYEWVDLWIDEGISLFVEKYCLNLKVEDYSPITEKEAINMTYQKGYLNYIDNTIVKYEGDDNFSLCAETLQNFRNDYFGSRLVVDNSEDFNSPDAFTGFENASEECDGNMMACVDKYGQEFVDGVIKEYADTVCNAVSEYDFDDTINYCVKDALKDMEYDPDEKRLVGCSLVPELCDWDDEEEFCNYFEDAYGFDWDSCHEFYEEYCNDIWHFADEYDDRMEDALRYFNNESVFDEMPYEINYNEDYINVYIDMDDFVNYIKKNMIFNDSMAQLFKYNDMGLNLYNMLPKSEDINEFYNDLISMLPVVTDVKLYDDGLYFWYDDITIRKFFDKHKVDDGWGTYVTADPINNYADEFLSSEALKTFFNLVEKDEDWKFYIDEDGDGDLYVSGNEGIYKTYFDDDVPMVQVYVSMMNKMNEEIRKYNN